MLDALYQDIGRDLFGSDNLAHDIAEIDPDDAAFFSLVLVGAEIDNGGFAQMFTNSTGELTDQTIRGARRFGLRGHEKILRDASDQLFGGNVPLDADERNRRWEALASRRDSVRLDAAIDALDERWYALDSVLEKCLLAYAAQKKRS